MPPLMATPTTMARRINRYTASLIMPSNRSCSTSQTYQLPLIQQRVRSITSYNSDFFQRITVRLKVLQKGRDSLLDRTTAKVALEKLSSQSLPMHSIKENFYGYTAGYTIRCFHSSLDGRRKTQFASPGRRWV